MLFYSVVSTDIFPICYLIMNHGYAVFIVLILHGMFALVICIMPLIITGIPSNELYLNEVFYTSL
jgi:hypothetical protein